MIDKKALTEMVKEAFRIALFAAIGSIIAFALSKVDAIQDPSITVIVVAGVLRALDRYVHEAKNIKLNGISPI